MNIGNKDIRRLYRAYLKENSPAGREACPPMEDILALFTKGRLLFRRKKTLTHALNCSRCSLGLKTAAEAQHLCGEIVDAALPLSVRDSPAGNRRTVLSLSPVRTGLVAALLFLGGFAAYRMFLKPGKIVLRSTRAGVALTVNDVERKEGESLVFSWQNMEAVDHYTVEIFKEDLSRLWTSGPLRNPSLSLPEDIRGLLEGKNPFYWMVTAHLKDGGTVESALIKLKFP